MKNLKIEELIKYDTPALTSIIEYWKDYETETVLLSFAELNRREYKFNEKLIIFQNEFCNNRNIETIENGLNLFLYSKGYNLYIDYYQESIKPIQKNNSKFILTYPEKIQEAGKSLKAIVTTTLFLIVCLVIGFFIIYNAKSIDTLKNTYIFIGIATLILNIIILINLFYAGDSLENSVKINPNQDDMDCFLEDNEPKTPSF
ncbi:MAG: hypothetical protein KA523_00855 [Flavobacterium sp.]|nr:hypothetical protein [Flavobacterium sp.]